MNGLSLLNTKKKILSVALISLCTTTLLSKATREGDLPSLSLADAARMLVVESHDSPDTSWSERAFEVLEQLALTRPQDKATCWAAYELHAAWRDFVGGEVEPTVEAPTYQRILETAAAFDASEGATNVPEAMYTYICQNNVHNSLGNFDFPRFQQLQYLALQGHIGGTMLLADHIQTLQSAVTRSYGEVGQLAQLAWNEVSNNLQGNPQVAACCMYRDVAKSNADWRMRYAALDKYLALVYENALGSEWCGLGRLVTAPEDCEYVKMFLPPEKPSVVDMFIWAKANYQFGIARNRKGLSGSKSFPYFNIAFEVFTRVLESKEAHSSIRIEAALRLAETFRIKAGRAPENWKYALEKAELYFELKGISPDGIAPDSPNLSVDDKSMIAIYYEANPWQEAQFREVRKPAAPTKNWGDTDSEDDE